MSAEEAARDPVDARRALLSHVRHELRAPISAIIGYSEMLLEEAADQGEELDEVCSDLEAIHAAGNEILALVNGPSMESALERGESGFRRSLRPMIASVLGYSEMLLGDSRNRFGEEAADDLLRVRDAGKRLLALVDEFAAPGRLDALLRKGTGE